MGRKKKAKTRRNYTAATGGGGHGAPVRNEKLVALLYLGWAATPTTPTTLTTTPTVVTETA